MQLLNGKRGLVLGLAIVVLTGTVVWAATEVTITKQSSLSAFTSSYDGTYSRYVNLTKTADGFYLNYQIFEIGVGLIERGYGNIDSSDASISSNGAWVDTDTSSIAIVGDGGDLDLEWTPDGVYTLDMDGKTTTDYGDRKYISFSGQSRDSAVVSGDFLGEDYEGTGQIRTYKGKTILQVK